MLVVRLVGFVLAAGLILWGLASIDSLEAGEPGGVVEANDRNLPVAEAVRVLDDSGPISEISLMSGGHRVRMRAEDLPVTDYESLLYDDRNGEPGFQPREDLMRARWSGSASGQLDGTAGFQTPNDRLSVKVKFGTEWVSRRIGPPLLATAPRLTWSELAELPDLSARFEWMRDDAGQLHVRCTMPSGSTLDVPALTFDGAEQEWFDDAGSVRRVVVPGVKPVDLRAVLRVELNRVRVEVTSVRER